VQTATPQPVLARKRCENLEVPNFQITSGYIGHFLKQSIGVRAVVSLSFVTLLSDLGIPYRSNLEPSDVDITRFH